MWNGKIPKYSEISLTWSIKDYQIKFDLRKIQIWRSCNVCLKNMYVCMYVLLDAFKSADTL